MGGHLGSAHTKYGITHVLRQKPGTTWNETGMEVLIATNGFSSPASSREPLILVNPQGAFLPNG